MQIGAANNWVSIAAGLQHCVGIKTDGTLWSWGSNSSGQVGDGITTADMQKTPVQIGNANNWVSATAGFYHTIALQSSSSLWAWGYNAYGQLGDGTIIQRNTPVQIIGQANIVSLPKGPIAFHAGVISAARNKICFTGENGGGQFGNGTTTSSSSYNCNNSVSLRYSLASSNVAYILPLGGLGNRTDFQKFGDLISAIIPSGASPISNTVADSVWIEPSVPLTANGNPYLQRHYGITPTANASTVTGTIILYFTQAEFTAFNAVPNHGLDLPIDAADAANNIANLRVIKRPGTSNGSGLYDTYTSAPTIIVPSSVVWSTLNNWWEVTFDVTGFSGFFVNTSPTIVLPLQLTAVSAKLLNNDGFVSWQTSNEQNTSHFEIERSTDGRNFIKAGKVNASGNIAAFYSYLDKNITGLSVSIFYYRLKMVDNDGKFTYSNIIPLNIGRKINVMTMYPNPVHDVAKVTVISEKKESIYYSVIDQYGRTIAKSNINIKEGSNSISIDTRLFASGVYLLVIEGEKINEQLRFIKL